MQLMTQKNDLKLFEEKKVRTVWDEEQEKWYFSIVDVIEVLTDSPRPRKYWNALKTKLKNEGSELSHILGQLKMQTQSCSSNYLLYRYIITLSASCFNKIQVVRCLQIIFFFNLPENIL